MFTTISGLIRLLSLISAIIQAIQLGKVAAQPTLYAAAPGGVVGVAGPMCAILALCVVGVIHPKGWISKPGTWICIKGISAFALWIDSSEPLQLAVKSLSAAVEKAKLLPEPTPPVK